MPRTREQQLHAIRSQKHPALAPAVSGALTLLTVYGLYRLYRHEGASLPFFVFAPFALILLVSLWRNPYGARHAALALENGRRVPGRVAIRVEEWTDGNSYFATASAEGLPEWSFEFIPDGWTPADGAVEAELFFLDGVRWPVMALTDTAAIVPRGTPRRGAAAAG